MGLVGMLENANPFRVTDFLGNRAKASRRSLVIKVSDDTVGIVESIAVEIEVVAKIV